ncbi:MAG: SDR family oxidoreductase [Luteibaculum sp.]
MKTAIVTGSSKGIGLATVNAFLNQGFSVVGWSRSKTTVDHPNFHWIACDVSQFAEVEKALKQSLTFLENRVDVLVNNAGWGIPTPILDCEPQQFDAMQATNVNGLFYCTRLVSPIMKEQGSGHIFNIASIAGTTGIEGMGAYCASKFAVRGFTLSIFKELRKYGIKVTGINPGSVNTDFFNEFEMVTADDSMMQASDIAKTIWNAYDTPKNFHQVEIEMRPLNR